MSTLTQHEQAAYEEVWGTLGATYDRWSPGVEYQALFLERVGDARGTLLDAGCGSGRAAVKLHEAGFQVALCDLTNEGLDESAKGLPFIGSSLWQDLTPVAYCAAAYYQPPPDPERMALPTPAVDYVYCTDVMEHIPPALTMLTVRNLCAIARRDVFIVLSHERDVNGFWVGRPLHQTVQPFTWWRDHLAEVSEVLEARDLIHHGVFWLKGQATC